MDNTNGSLLFEIQVLPVLLYNIDQIFSKRLNPISVLRAPFISHIFSFPVPCLLIDKPISNTLYYIYNIYCILTSDF